MSYVLSTYLVRLDEIDRVLFSGDRHVLERAEPVLAAWSQRLSDPPAADALRESVSIAVEGPLSELLQHPDAILALRVLAETSGQWLDGPGLNDVHLSLSDELGTVGERLNHPRLPPGSKLAAIADGWPEPGTLNCITADEAESLLKEVSATIDEWPDTGADPGVFEAYTTLEEWLTACTEERRDLLLFLE